MAKSSVYSSICIYICNESYAFQVSSALHELTPAVCSVSVHDQCAVSASVQCQTCAYAPHLTHVSDWIFGEHGLIMRALWIHLVQDVAHCLRRLLTETLRPLPSLCAREPDGWAVLLIQIKGTELAFVGLRERPSGDLGSLCVSMRLYGSGTLRLARRGRGSVFFCDRGRFSLSSCSIAALALEEIGK